jgi:hypothetical protein
MKASFMVHRNISFAAFLVTRFACLVRAVLTGLFSFWEEAGSHIRPMVVFFRAVFVRSLPPEQ